MHKIEKGLLLHPYIIAYVQFQCHFHLHGKFGKAFNIRTLGLKGFQNLLPLSQYLHPAGKIFPFLTKHFSSFLLGFETFRVGTIFQKLGEEQPDIENIQNSVK